MKLLCVTVLCAAGCLRPMASVSSVAWQEYQSEHFILDTDVSEEDAASIVATFEALRAADLAMLAGADFPGRIRLFVPAQLEQYQKLARKDDRAFYTHSMREPVIVAPASLCLRLPQVPAHELAHAVSAYLYPQQRTWFSEGLAQVLETVGRASVRTTGQTAEVSGNEGEVLPKLSGFLSGQYGLMPASMLLAATAKDRDKDPELFYVSSWALYHWLWNAHPAELAAFQKRLSAGEGFDEAWLQAFPDLDPANARQMNTLDATLLVYRRLARFRAAPVEAKQAFTIARRPFPEMRYWAAILRQSWPAEKEQLLRQELEQARADDPANPDVLVRLAVLDGGAPVDTIRAIAFAAPDRFSGWLLLSQNTADAVEKEDALRRALALDPGCSVCNNKLAWLLAVNGRAKEALPFANRAVALEPWQASFADTLAEVTSRLGQCREGLQLEERAARQAAFAGLKREYEARLAAVKARCPAK